MRNSILKENYRLCENIIKENSKSFYAAFSLLPKDKAQAVYAIYAFCRFADDLVDNESNIEKKNQNLKILEEELADFLNGGIPKRYFWICLKDVFNRFDMDPEAFKLQLKGQLWDINFQQPDNLNDLLQYSYYVASSVGLMMLPIIATQNHKVLYEEAKKLGIAMQITNILRDIGEDYKKLNRIYLPKQLMNEYNITNEMIAYNIISNDFINLWESLAKVAEEYYHIFYNQINLFDQDSQKQLILSAKIYSEILNTIRNDNYSFLLKRNYVSKDRILKIISVK